MNNLKSIAHDFHEVLEFISKAPLASKKIHDLKDHAHFRKVKLAWVDEAALHDELARSGARWNALQSPMGGAFFHASETVVMLVRGQEVALSALILVHELSHVRDFEYGLNREKQNRLAIDIKKLGTALLIRHKAGHKITATELSALETKRKEFDDLQSMTTLKAETFAYEETRLFIQEMSLNPSVDLNAWSHYILELRQKGHTFFSDPNEAMNEEKIQKMIRDRYKVDIAA